jgi:glycosyltransferase involved in cell wall biosynthesis
VVASSRGGVGQFITDGVDGVLSSDDAGMTAALIRLVVDREHRATMIERAHRSVPDFSWQTAIARSLTAYARARRIMETTRLESARLPILLGVGGDR